MWQLAVRTLIYDRIKFVTALIGVVFSIVLMNLQGGLFVGLIRKASLLVDCSDADIWVGHRGIHNVDFPNDIPRMWRERIRGVPGVRRVESLVVGHSIMALPDGGFEPVLIVGAEPTSQLGVGWGQGKGAAEAIRRPNAIIADVYDLEKLGNPLLEDRREIAHHQAKIVGQSRGLLGFLITPYVVTTVDRAIQYLGRRRQECSYFLVATEDGQDPSIVRNRIRQNLPEADVFTRRQYAQLSIDYWLKRTGLGISFGAATALGLLVGLIIVAQTLYASVLDRIKEFAAIKAMGATEAKLRNLILIQSGVLGITGSMVGLAVVAVVQLVFNSPRAPIAIPWYVSAGSCVLVIAMCLFASILPYLRIRRVEPAMVLNT